MTDWGKLAREREERERKEWEEEQVKEEVRKINRLTALNIVRVVTSGMTFQKPFDVIVDEAAQVLNEAAWV